MRAETERVPDKQCRLCFQSYPATGMYFDRDESRPDGLRTECKSCRAEERKVEVDPELAEAIKGFDKDALNLLNEFSKSKIDIESVPHLATVLQRVMEALGGAQGYARHLISSMLAAKPGSPTRLRHLEMIGRLAQKVTESGAAKVPKELLDDEDLEREIARRKRLLIYSPGGTDAKAS